LPEVVEKAVVATVVLAVAWFTETLASIAIAAPAEFARRLMNNNVGIVVDVYKLRRRRAVIT
jgi:hypothetical protein